MVPQRNQLKTYLNQNPQHKYYNFNQLKKELQTNNYGNTIVFKNQWKYQTLKSYEEYLLSYAENIVNCLEKFMGILKIQRQSACNYLMSFTQVLQTNNEPVQDIESLAISINDQFKKIAKAIADSLFSLGDRTGVEQFEIRLKAKLDKVFQK